jgi:hypothetical protein
MTTDIKLNGCFTKDINHIVCYINYCKKINPSLNVEAEIITHTNIKTKELIASYNLQYCKTIINSHSKNSIFNAIKRIQGPIDYSSEINFYRQIVFAYVYDIVYKKIKAMQEIMMIPAIPLTEPTECSICMSNIGNTRLMTVTRCNHCFHRNCLLKWKAIKANPTCPNCRVPI